MFPAVDSAAPPALEFEPLRKTRALCHKTFGRAKSAGEMPG